MSHVTSARDLNLTKLRNPTRNPGPRLEEVQHLCLVLRLLLLSPAAMGRCSSKYHELLRQLQQQAKLQQDRRRLLEPYVSAGPGARASPRALGGSAQRCMRNPTQHGIHIQGLDKPVLQEHCKEQPGAFPSEDALQGLSRQSFLQTLDARLGLILHRLEALQRGLPDAEFLGTARLNIRGLRNNIHCMARLLLDTSEAAPPTQAAPWALPLANPTSDAFQRKLEGCRFLSGYHRFMHSVGQVLQGWQPSPRRSRRHSPGPALRKGTGRTRPSRKGRRTGPRAQLPP
ncbi:Oncostatin-M [Galemys pyrenaicus]|uniref:Oncostatin-M n=1 Tax=Galemys pyrenaicus TaxID=202257 RepID=A0A8J6DTG1_GALPY|nr:Oncostatin-M [Galemys pyrenaicus]